MIIGVERLALSLRTTKLFDPNRWAQVRVWSSVIRKEAESAYVFACFNTCGASFRKKIEKSKKSAKYFAGGRV